MSGERSGHHADVKRTLPRCLDLRKDWLFMMKMEAGQMLVGILWFALLIVQVVVTYLAWAIASMDLQDPARPRHSIVARHHSPHARQPSCWVSEVSSYTKNSVFNTDTGARLE